MSSKPSIALVQALFVLTAALSCGSSSNDLDRNKTLASLTVAEQAQLCDEINNVQGGYGQSKTCPGGVETTDASKSDCLQNAPGVAQVCGTQTVGTFVDCAHATASDLCLFETAPACEPLRTCSGH